MSEIQDSAVLSSPFYSFELKKGVVTAVFNRPQRCNSLSLLLLEKFRQLLKELEERPGVRILILQGNGNHFCSGLDLTEASDGEILTIPEQEWVRFQKAPFSRNFWEGSVSDKGEAGFAVPKAFWMPRLVADILWRLIHLPQIVIGAARGAVFGGGGGILSACDIAIGTRDLKIGFPESRRGFSTGLLHPFLRRRITPNRLLPLLLTGSPFDGEAGLRIGLIDQLLSSEEDPVEEAVRRADEVLCGEPKRIAEIKRIQISERGPAEGDVFQGLFEHWKSWQTPEAAEGIRAFREKRLPNWD